MPEVNDDNLREVMWMLEYDDDGYGVALHPDEDGHDIPLDTLLAIGVYWDDAQRMYVEHMRAGTDSLLPLDVAKTLRVDLTLKLRQPNVRHLSEIAAVRFDLARQGSKVRPTC